MSLENRICLVTGGGRAIGKAIAVRLAVEGADVAVVGPDRSELETTASEIRSRARRAFTAVTDVAEEDQVRDCVGAIQKALGRIDVLVNNAGIIGPTAPVVDVDRRQWDEVLAVNLTGAMLCSKAVLPGMIERRRGKIINIASMAGKIGYALRSPYAVSKWGLVGLTRTLAKEVGGDNIQVNAVCPGPVRGERMQRIIERRAQETGLSVDDVEKEYVDTTALGRMVEAEDVAALVAFLASDASNNVTGQAIDVSAGYAI